MSDNKTPDRASDFDDIPTYTPQPAKQEQAVVSPSSHAQPLSDNASDGAEHNSVHDSVSAASARNIYNRAGRAAPQMITPHNARKPVEQETRESAPATEVMNAQTQSSVQFPQETTAPVQPEHTAVLDRPQSAGRNAPLASDAPTSQYADEDFAPVAPSPAAPQVVAPSTTSFDMPEAQAEMTPESAFAAAPQPVTVVEDKRGTIDFGLLVLRLITAIYLIAQSTQVFFNLGSEGGINQLEADFSAYTYADLLAVAVPAAEFAAGVFLFFGLLSPVASAVAIVATGFMLLHTVYFEGIPGVFDISDSVWLAGIIFLLTISLQFTGPGRISLDVSRSWAKRPLVSSWLFAVLGIAGAVALWWFGAGVGF
ncbi:DoxX family protein [Corynebacterium sp. sy039]|uniref:DoxX family protein n=1 Tax=Corynebacterium sp. sy039 TaxID=2599641 RepID=UPI0011B834DC|nr:DoxX family protein [Corynebacterium sp. sy039]QDZ42413.1 DoxX family protein [Corynebacterium sp. sy039]